MDFLVGVYMTNILYDKTASACARTGVRVEVPQWNTLRIRPVEGVQHRDSATMSVLIISFVKVGCDAEHCRVYSK